MEKRVANKLSLVVFGTVAMMAASCTSTSVEDVYKGPKVEAEKNPLRGLNPSSSFTWSTMEHSKVTIEVDDHFGSKFDYYVNLYAENPQADNKPNAIFSAVARGNKPASCELDLPSSTRNIYVEVTDPQGHVMTYGYAAPKAKASVTLPCVIGEEAQGNVKEAQVPDTQTKMVSFDYDFTMPDAVTAPAMDWSVPADAEELPDNDKWNKSAEYTVPANTTLTLTNNRSYSAAWKGTTRIVVEGTLDIQDFNLTLAQGAQLYVKDGGKVIGNKITLNEGSILASEKGGELQLNQVISNGATYFYTAGTAFISKEINFNNADANIYVAPTGQIIGAAKNDEQLEDMTYTMNFTALQGQLYIDADVDNSGQFWCASVTNVNGGAEFVIAPNADMYVAGAVSFQCPIYNAGLFTASTMDGKKVDTARIYNACTMIVKEHIMHLGFLFMKDATLSGGVSTNANNELVFEPMQLFSYRDDYDSVIYLVDGSYIDVNNFTIGAGTEQGSSIFSDGDVSLMRVRKQLKTSKWYALYINSKMVLEYSKLNGNVVPQYGASVARLGSTAIDLETCTGNIPTREEDPNDDIIQVDPFVGSVESGYTVNFEDQWPVIGDYDVNDIVLHIDQIETLQTANEVKEVTFTIDLQAVGAGYMLGAGIQLDNITNGEIASVEYSMKDQAGMLASDKGAFSFGSNGAEAGSGASSAVLPICYDAHKAFLNKATISKAERKPLNTGDGRTEGRTLTIKVVFADGAAVSPTDLMVSALNFFIFRPEDEAATGGKRVEVHLKDYAPTSRATDVYNGTGNDASTKNYVSADGFPWGIIVNDIGTGDNAHAWGWPRESKLITNQYSGFELWVNSNGTEALDWMVQ